MARTRIDDLLLSFLRTNTDGEGVSETGELSGADWDDLLQRSGRHGTTPLLYHRLKTVHTGAPVPPVVMQKMRNIYLQNAGRNMHLYRELGEVLAALRSKETPVIALKGAYLASAVYRNIALRPMSDVDLLINKRDILKVQRALVELGYAASKEDVFSAHEQLPAYRKKDSVYVEIHFNITEPPFSSRVDVGKMFARSQPCLIDGIEALSLCPEDLLLHLCMHASYHHGFDNGIMPLFDIAKVIEQYKGELDWEQVFSRSKEWGVEKCVYVTLSLANAVAGASVPVGFRGRVGFCSDGFDAGVVAEEFLFGKRTGILPNLARLFGNGSLREKVVHFLHRVFPPVTVMAGLNPGGKDILSICLLYYSRVKGLFLRHGQTTWKLFLRDKEMSAFAEMENSRNVLKDWLRQ